MGNGCSVFKLNKHCLDGDLNIVLEQEDLENKEENKNNVAYKKRKSNKLSSTDKQISIGSNGIKYKTELNKHENDKNNSNSSQVNAIQSQENSKGENIMNNPKSNFTNFMQDLDFSFNNNNKEGLEQNDVFDHNYINIKNEYNEEIIDYLNKIRNEPNSIINDIEKLLNKSQNIIDNKIQIESEETHENIILDDGGTALFETKKYLNEVVPVKVKFNINEDLYIDIPESEKNLELPLDKKVTKILMNKRKNIIKDYPKCQFFINFIKDKKIGLIFLLSQNENMSNFRNILFNEQYTEFNVTWMKDKKKIFIAFLCFA